MFSNNVANIKPYTGLLIIYIYNAFKLFGIIIVNKITIMFSNNVPNVKLYVGL